MNLTLARKWSILIFLIALLATGSVHLINRSYLRDASPAMLRDDITVRTADDASYLAPVENFLAGKGWHSNAVGDAAYTTRSPGYGFYYLIFRSLLSQKAALAALMAFQILLFAFAVSRIPEMALYLGISAKWGIAIALVVATLTTFSGFLSYTLTEGLTPSLVLIFLFFLLKAVPGSATHFFMSILVLAVLILVRPAMLVWVFSLPIAVWRNNIFRKGRKLYGLIFIAFVPLLAWQVWAFAKTNSYAGLHPIYHRDSNDLYRPLHRDIWNFHKSWGQKGVDFHHEITALWQDAIDGTLPDGDIQQILASIDPDAVKKIGKENLKSAYSDYYNILSRQAKYYKNAKPMPGISSEEARLSIQFQEFRSEYVRSHWFYSNVAVPVEVYWRLAGHSNLSLFMFQRPLRGNMLTEIFRWLSFLIHSGTFLIFPIACFSFMRNRRIQILGLPVLLYLGYLCMVQRGIEERYTAPVLIPMVLVVIFAIYRLYRKKRITEIAIE